MNTKLFQFEVDYRNIDCGMFYAIQCPDNSFFLIDSAHQDSAKDHIRIHDFLKSLIPEGEKILIRGWFLSHAHQDHIVKFMDFLNTYEDFELEGVYYNFPEPDGFSSEYWKEEDKITMREFKSLMEERRDLKKIILHTGDKFDIENLKFEVLATWEDVYPDTLENFNDSSTILMMECEGTKVFWPGDAGNKESELVAEKYGKALKSDILQLAHHGFKGGSIGLYEYVNAPTVLVSNNQEIHEHNMDKETTRKAIELSKEFFIAGNGTVELELPYTCGTAKVHPQTVNNIVL